MPNPLHCVIDIEASGFGRGSYPIEIGYVRENGQGWCTLIYPADEWLHWDDSAERLHGIRRDVLLKYGRPTDAVARQINKALAGRTVYCDGWANDYTWLAVLFDAAGMVPRFKLESVRQLLDDASLSQLDALRRDAFATLGVSRHRASSDARVLQWALQQLTP